VPLVKLEIHDFEVESASEMDMFDISGRNNTVDPTHCAQQRPQTRHSENIDMS
jgi:hypothetical protein